MVLIIVIKHFILKESNNRSTLQKGTLEVPKNIKLNKLPPNSYGANRRCT